MYYKLLSPKIELPNISLMPGSKICRTLNNVIMTISASAFAPAKHAFARGHLSNATWAKEELSLSAFLPTNLNGHTFHIRFIEIRHEHGTLADSIVFHQISHLTGFETVIIDLLEIYDFSISNQLFEKTLRNIPPISNVFEGHKKCILAIKSNLAESLGQADLMIGTPEKLGCTYGGQHSILVAL